ncbi:hypothetical protein D3C87_2021680 [compost metagenome]
MADAISRQSASISAEAANSTALVPSACTLKPMISLKSVRPLLPPKPMSLRKKARSSA